MGITNVLCQALQQQSQDVVSAMILVRGTKTLIQELREDGRDKLYTNVTSFWVRHDIEIFDLDDTHSTTRYGRSRLEENEVTIEHYFKVEIFLAIIDQQLQELNSRFSEQIMDL
ncbi:hypothetical protein QL285_019386 [Trifolium repens]|nr:hypothetical protein QL285_019386 [Trifolium repens]